MVFASEFAICQQIVVEIQSAVIFESLALEMLEAVDLNELENLTVEFDQQKIVERSFVETGLKKELVAATVMYCSL